MDTTNPWLAALALAAACLAPAPAAAQAVTETCGIYVVRSAEQTDYVPILGYSVTNAPLPLTRPAGQAQVDGVVCDRLSLELRPNDYHVLTDLRVPFYVRSGVRTVALESPDGQLRVRFLTGAPTDAERTQLGEALDRAMDAVAAAAPAN
jgi:hypothetical protein